MNIIMNMNQFLYTVLLISLLGTVHVDMTAQTEANTFYFDYRIEYAYSTPSVPNGQIIAYYNSLDKYVSYAFISPFMEDGTQVIAFFDGSSIVFSDEPGVRKGIIYQATLPGRKPSDTHTNDSGEKLREKVTPTGKTVDIAGYEAAEYSGILDDGSKRTLWISEESFDARTLHTPIHGSMNILPLPLTEAGFLGPEQFLLGSEILLEGGERYSLTVTYLEYELNRIQFIDFDMVLTDVGNNMASNHHAHQSLLREAKYEVWQDYDRMSGLEYAPMTYDFDRHYTYRLTTAAGTLDVDVYFNTAFEFCGITSKQFPENLEFILGFKNGTMIAYYEDELGVEPTEAIFFAPAGSSLHLDHPENLRWTEYSFKNKWQPTGQTQTIAGLSSTGYQLLDESAEQNKLYLYNTPFDPRSLYMEYSNHITGFPPVFSSAYSLPPYQLITRWTGKDGDGQDIQLELISADNEVEFIFSDEEIEQFNKVVRR